MNRLQILINTMIRDTKEGYMKWLRELDCYTSFNGYDVVYQYQHQMLYIGKAAFYVNHPFNQHLLDAINNTLTSADNDAVLDHLVGN